VPKLPYIHCTYTYGSGQPHKVAPVKNPRYQSHLALHPNQSPLYLICMLNTWWYILIIDIAGNLAFWGVLWGPLRILHPLWQGKGAFLRLPRSTSASGYKQYKFYIAILQCRIRGRGTGKACEWEALTQRTQGEKTENMSLHTCFEFPPGFCSQSCGQIIWLLQNLNGVTRWPGWFSACFFSPDIGALFPTVPSHSVHEPQLTPELRANKRWFQN